MADLGTPFPQMAAAADDREVVFNGLVDALSPAGLYGRDWRNATGLLWYYLGGRWASIVVADGFVTATNTATNYVVAHRTTGVVSISTSITNWNDSTTYARTYLLTAAGGVITDYEDHRSAIGGSGVSGVTNFTDLGDVPSSYSGQTLKFVRVNAGETALEFTTASGSGDASTNTATSVDSEITLFSSTTGKLLKRATGTGYAKVTSGVLSADSTATVNADLQGTGLVAGAAGFREIPQNSQSTAYTTVAADSGKHIFHPSSDSTARTFTIDSNANVAYPIGTAITFIAQTGSGVVTIAITSDTLTLAGTGTAGSRTLTPPGIATAVKIATTEWYISGTGLT